MMPYSRLKFSDFYTLSQMKLLKTPPLSQQHMPIWLIYGSIPDLGGKKWIGEKLRNRDGRGGGVIEEAVDVGPLKGQLLTRA